LISRGDFVFTIGYEGNTSVVDGAMKKRYGSLSAAQLAEQGLYKQALCSVIYDQSAAAAGRSGSRKGDGGEPGGTEALERVLELYNRNTDHKLSSVDELKRVFGVFEVPPGIGKVMVV
jgi:hypothetical protein